MNHRPDKKAFEEVAAYLETYVPSAAAEVRRAAEAEPPPPAPVAWRFDWIGGDPAQRPMFRTQPRHGKRTHGWSAPIPLYAAPPAPAPTLPDKLREALDAIERALNRLRLGTSSKIERIEIGPLLCEALIAIRGAESEAHATKNEAKATANDFTSAAGADRVAPVEPGVEPS